MIVGKERKGTFSITFCEQAENHVGMQKIGEIAKEGFKLEDLMDVAKRIEGKLDYEIINLKYTLTEEDLEELGEDGEVQDAYIMIIRESLKPKESNELYDEQLKLPIDKKAFMRGKVVNKHARWNVCYAEESQEPDIEKGKGTIISFDSVPRLNEVRKALYYILGEKGKDLYAELNYYYDVKKCYIGFHGDSERKKVVCVRLGEDLPMQYQWFRQSKPVGKRVKFTLGHGDMYIMSEKAVGNDWKKRKIATLRHAAGFENCIPSNQKILEKIRKNKKK